MAGGAYAAYTKVDMGNWAKDNHTDICVDEYREMELADAAAAKVAAKSKREIEEAIERAQRESQKRWKK